MPHQAHQPPLPQACDERREGFTICCTCYRTSKQGSPIRSGIADALADCSQRWDGYLMHKMKTRVIAIALSQILPSFRVEAFLCLLFQ